MKINELNKTALLTPHQKEVFDSIIGHIEERVENLLKSDCIEKYLLSLTGAAGTGKTYLTVQIARYFEEKVKSLTYPQQHSYSFVITAPTHKAVSVIADTLQQAGIEASCKTIHSFLGIKPFIDYNTGVECYTVDKTNKTKESTAILMVDESSMIGAELYHFILEAIEEGRVDLVLFIGDPYQLLPVNDSVNPVYELKYQFSLTEVVRQANDSYIINIATELRERIVAKEFIDLKQFFMECGKRYAELYLFHNKVDFLEAFYEGEKWFDDDKILASHRNKNVDAFNREIRRKYWHQKGIDNPPTLVSGDKLRFKEAYSVRDITLYYNNQIVKLEKVEKLYHETLHIEYWECKAVGCSKQQIFRVVDPESASVFNDKLDLIAKNAKRAKFPDNRKLWKAFYKVRNMFVDVQYVFSSTIHKLQGSTYDETFIDLFSLADNHYMGMEEKYRLAYVAVTRASREVRVFIPATSEKFFLNQDIDMLKEFSDMDRMIEVIMDIE